MDPYRLFNLDVFEYELNSQMSLYGAIPFVMGHSKDRSVAVLWLNAAETWVDINSPLDSKVSFSLQSLKTALHLYFYYEDVLYYNFV